MTTTTYKQVPASAFRFTLDDDAVVRLAEDGEDQQKPARFAIVANSGKPIAHPWWGMLGIQLDGIKAKKRVPILMDHNVTQRLGYSDQRELTGRGLELQGVFLNNQLAAGVLAESKDGFPFEASVHLRATKLERVEEGQEVDVNGHKMKGPGYVFRKSELREVSFCALGADPNTSAAALSGSEPEFAVELTEPPTEATMTEKKDTTAGGSPAPTPTPSAAEIRQQAVLAERQRVATINSLAHPTQLELAKQLVADGATIEDATVQLHADMRNRYDAQLAALGTSGDKPLSGGNRANPTGEPTALEQAKKLPDGREKWVKLYQLDEQLRDEFSSEAAYLAFMEAPPAR